MRCALLLATLLLGVLPAAAEDDEPAKPYFFAPTEWLTIGPVDARARRPFNPDAVFARYLHARNAGIPHEGDEIRGERGAQTWKKASPDKQGRVGGRIAWAFTRVESDRERVVVARLLNGARLFVNGTAAVGAVYGHGFQVAPVLLRKGTNDVFVRGVRGRFKLTLEQAPGPVFVAPRPLHLPDLVEGEPLEAVAGVWIVNAQTEAIGPVRIRVKKNAYVAAAETVTPGGIPPLGMLQVKLPIRAAAVPAGTPHVDVVFTLEGAPISRLVRLPVRKPADSILRTFVSKIDDSVQVYAVRRPAPPEGNTRPMGLVLSLHGAGVDPRSQANAYSAKPDFWIVCPTNRARFGFDWQDWGRTDAYEVLVDALALTGVERSRVYLTGHSMGGHGTWHLAANDPDGFAAIAPSAGWISFSTYGSKRPQSPLSKLWRSADAQSDTRALMDNLVQLPTYIVHGTKDDNVPVEQARAMEKLLAEAGAPPQVHYAEGKGHWWNGKAAEGADCVDWPGIFELFRAHAIPRAPLDLRFTTPDLGIDARHHWVELHVPMTYGKPSRVEITSDVEEKRFAVTLENVWAFSLRHPRGFTRATVDGFPVELIPGGGTSYLQRGSGVPWVVRPTLEPHAKNPTACGPFKRAFENGFVLVYGTKGSAEETRELLERARHDAAAWVSRANGQGRVLADAEYLALRDTALRDRNVILYGNADTNAAFAVLHPTHIRHFLVKRGSMRIGDEPFVGNDLAAVFVLPQRDREGALAGVFADSGVAGTRLGYALLPFVSGVGYPDYVAFDQRVLTKGDKGVLAAGWLGRRWLIQEEGRFSASK